MAATYKNIALAGASGSLGTTVMKALVDAGFNVTVLTRPESSTSFPADVQICKVDYSDFESLTTALKNQDAVISTIGYPGMQGQTLLVDAAIAAGVKRIIPSEYGSDPEDFRIRSLPVFGHKVEVEQHIKQKIAGTATTFTLICNNEFFDWDLDNNFGANIKNKKIKIFDGGNHIYSAAPLDFVAGGAVAVLRRPHETANRVIRLHGMSMTQNRLLEIMQSCTAQEGWDITHACTAERKQEGYKLLQSDPGNMYAWAMPFLHCAVFGQDFRNDFSGNNDNELLGLQELSEAEIEDIVRSRHEIADSTLFRGDARRLTLAD